MKQMKFLIGMFLVSIFSLSATRDSRLPELVKGKIIDIATQSPVENAYIYIISGEEETLSSRNGSFEITTWQAFPLTITINHEQYQKLAVVYKKADDRHVIKLEKK
jgi:hypothetical protein